MSKLVSIKVQDRLTKESVMEHAFMKVVLCRVQLPPPAFFSSWCPESNEYMWTMYVCILGALFFVRDASSLVLLSSW